MKLWRDRPEQVLSTLLVGNNIVNVAGSVLAARVAHHYLESYADAVAVGVMTLLVLTFGEILPKSVARAGTLRFARVAIWLLKPFYLLFYPAAWVFARSAHRLVEAILGMGAHDQPVVTEGEIEYLIGVGQREGVFERAEQGKMLEAIFEFNETLVREVMVPRMDVVALAADASIQEALDVAIRSGHSRIPVYEGDIDGIIGVLHVKDLLEQAGPNSRHPETRAADVMRKHTLCVPETQRIARLLREIQRQNSHMALVVDEYGGVAGIVTLEDIIEEIVGEIRDEYDGSEVSPVQQVSGGGWEVLGRLNLADLAEHLGSGMPEHPDVDTVGGLMAAELGHLPEPGEYVIWSGYRFEVIQADRRRVHRVLVMPVAGEPAGEGPAS